jgi:hypothetical protein
LGVEIGLWHTDAVPTFSPGETRSLRLARDRARQAKEDKKARKRGKRAKAPPKPKIRRPLPEPAVVAPSRSIRVVIFTYERPQALLRLLRDLYASQGNHTLSVAVYDDGSKADYSAPLAMLEGLGWEYVQAPKHHGKRGFWRWVSRAYAEQRKRSEPFFVFLPDDVRLCRDFLTRTLTAWDAVDDPDKVALTLLRDTGRRNWTGVRPQPQRGAIHVGWVDGAFACTKRYLQALDFSCPSVRASRWKADPTLGSGVGAVVSPALKAQGLRMYGVRQSLLVHCPLPSRMNPEARARNPLRTIEFIDGEAELARLSRPEHPPVVVSLASMAYRVNLLRRVVASLYWQCDQLNVYLNGYHDVPDFLERPRICVATSQHHGDRGDAGKFFWCGELRDTYHLTCDDDILYPPDYTAHMCRKVEQYNRRALVGLHGAILNKHPRRSYYQERRLVLRCTRRVSRDRFVHVLGTGVLAYHTSTLALSPAVFRVPNMADVWLGVAAKRQRIPLVVVRHTATWIRTLRDPNPRQSIYRRFSKRDKAQARAVREAAPWNGPRGVKG